MKKEFHVSKDYQDLAHSQITDFLQITNFAHKLFQNVNPKRILESPLKIFIFIYILL